MTDARFRPWPESTVASVVPGSVAVAAGLLVAAPLSLAAWAVGALALRLGARRWQLGTVAAALAALALLADVLPGAAGAARNAVAAWPGIGTPPKLSAALLGPFLALVARWAVATWPLAGPLGLAAAALNRPPSGELTPGWQAEHRRAQQRTAERERRRAGRTADRVGADPASEAFGVALEPVASLPDWRRGRLIVLPRNQLELASILIGAPGAGKTVAEARLAYLAARERRHLTVVDAKGGADGLADDVVGAVLAAWPDARIRLFPNEPIDLWRGDHQALVNRLVATWDWTAESSWYREVAMVALRLALAQPGPPCRSAAELVDRLDPAALASAWDGHPAELGLIRGNAKELPGVHIRVANLVAALGGAFDGAWSFEDCDVAIVTVPAMVAPRDADSALRVLLADYAHFTMARKPAGQPSLLVVDEFSAIAGGRQTAIDLLERGRGGRSGVILAAQTVAALGTDEQQARLLGSTNALLAFRTPQPAELAALAGSERVAEGAWSFEGADPARTPDGFRRVTVTERARARLDQDQVRAARTGEVAIIVAGRVERARVIRTVVPPEALEVARGLTRPRPSATVVGDPAPNDGPAAAVAVRVPGPTSPPQAPRRPEDGPAASGLDPAPSSRVRRYRPAGPGGEASPANDRNPEEEPCD